MNVIFAGDQLYCSTESNGLSLLDKDTLEKKGRVSDLILITFKTTLLVAFRQVVDARPDVVAVNSHTAHPHIEKDGSVVNLGTAYKSQCAYGIIKMPPPEKGFRKTSEETSIETKSLFLLQGEKRS